MPESAPPPPLAPPEACAPFGVACLDAVAWLRTLPSASVDLLVTDPAYQSLEKHRAVGTTTRLKHSKSSSNDWFAVFPNERFDDLFAEVYRVLRKHRHFYLFCDAETMFVARPKAEAAGFKFWKPLVWDKRRIGMGYHYRARYELILFFEKGKRKLNDLGVADVLEVPRIHGGRPAEKPVALSEILIRQSTCAGELVADPFMGSGSVGVAALRRGCRFLGNDIAPAAVAHARARLAAEVEDFGAPVRSEAGAGQLVLPAPRIAAARRAGTSPLASAAERAHGAGTLTGRAAAR